VTLAVGSRIADALRLRATGDCRRAPTERVRWAISVARCSSADRKSPDTQAIFDNHDYGTSEWIVGDIAEIVENRSDLIVGVTISPQLGKLRRSRARSSPKLVSADTRIRDCSTSRDMTCSSVAPSNPTSPTWIASCPAFLTPAATRGRKHSSTRKFTRRCATEVRAHNDARHATCDTTVNADWPDMPPD